MQWFADIKLRIHLRTLDRKLHHFQESICEHDVRVISTYKGWVRKQFIANHLHRFLTNTKDVHSSVGRMFVYSFPDSQDVKALQGPFANKMFASVYAALNGIRCCFTLWTRLVCAFKIHVEYLGVILVHARQFFKLITTISPMWNTGRASSEAAIFVVFLNVWIESK